MTQAAYQRICAHAKSDMDNEVGGWLAGRWCRDIETGTEFVVVEALLPAQQVRSGSTFLTFTHDSQVAMLAALEERYTKKGVVGWYHTHPRMGVFLSGYDTWLHNHFFPQPWQVALVVEPHSCVGGFFVRDKENHLDARKYFGFYELHNRRAESIVKWKNLHAEEKAEPKKEQKPELKAPEPAAQPYQVTVEPKIEAGKTEAKPAKLGRKEFKELIATQPVKLEEPSRKVEVKKTEPAHVVKTNNAGKTKTETNGSKRSEEAQS